MIKIQLVVTILLCLSLVFSLASCASAPTPQPLPPEESEVEEPEVVEIVREFKVSHSSAVPALPTGAEELALEFMTRYYETQLSLIPQDISDLYLDSGSLDYHANTALWEILTLERRLQTVDSSLNEYETKLHFIVWEERDDGDFYMFFREYGMLGFSEYKNLYSLESDVAHALLLRKVGDEYKIIKHIQPNGIFSLLIAGYTGTEISPVDFDNTEALQYIVDKKEAILDQIELEAKKRRSAFESQKSSALSLPHWEHDYLRNLAFDYAMQWHDDRNALWESYDFLGGNCANYTSQALFAGGIPMDFSGEFQWKWYDDYPNTQELDTGRSASWSGVKEFYDYIEENEDTGLIGAVGENFYRGEVGDIIQYAVLDDWKHQVIIVDVVEDESGNVIDYLVNSNTSDQAGFPNSAYTYPQQRLIKIYGWNATEEQEDAS